MADPGDENIDPLLPRQRLPADPNAAASMVKALAGGMIPSFDYLQAPTGPTSFQPNEAGKIPPPDPLAGIDKYARGALDVASMLPVGGGSLVGKGLGLAALHLLPFMGEELMEEAAPTAAKYLNSKQFHLVNDLGHAVGNAEFSYDPELKRIWVHSIESDEGPSSIGTADTRSLIAALKKEYPEAETVSGVRISGACKAGKEYKPSQQVNMKLPDK